ncbi:MAG: CRISPR-associated endonuclease Cas3'' [Candidatus Jordarchaeales archaeon]
MKPCAFVGQPLTSHIEGCLSMLEAFTRKNQGYFEVASRRIRAALGERTVEPEKVEEMARLAVLFHDVGKAYNYFQKRFDDNCSSNRVGFQYHEVASAAMCYKFLSTQPKWASVEKVLVVLSVLNHHHAMRNPFKMISEGDDRGKVLGIVKEGFCEGDLPSTFEKFNVNLRGAVLRGEDVSSFYSWINGVRKMNRVEKWLKLYVLVMNPLIIADNLDARRRGEVNEVRRAFIEEIEEVV